MTHFPRMLVHPGPQRPARSAATVVLDVRAMPVPFGPRSNTSRATIPSNPLAAAQPTTRLIDATVGYRTATLTFAPSPTGCSTVASGGTASAGMLIESSLYRGLALGTQIVDVYSKSRL